MSWIVAKCKTNEVETFKKSLNDLLGDSVEYYQPKIQYEKFLKKKNCYKKIKKFILGNYLFCNSEHFINTANTQKLKFIKGLQYFLIGAFLNQKDIINFIENCKKNEDENGSLKQEFFSLCFNKNYKFLTGPFKNQLFKIISEQNKKLLILLNNKKITLFRDSKYLFQTE